jgi:hypothetical protein
VRFLSNPLILRQSALVIFNPVHLSINFCSYLCYILPCLFFLMAILMVELKALLLPGRYSTTWATPPVLFILIIFKIRSHFMPSPAWTTFHRAGMTDICHHTSHWLRWGPVNFLLGLAANCDPSASWLARMTVLNHCTWLLPSFFGFDLLASLPCSLPSFLF